MSFAHLNNKKEFVHMYLRLYISLENYVTIL